MSLVATWNLVLRRFFCCWCCCLTAFRNPVATRNHVACSRSELESAERWATFAMLEEQIERRQAGVKQWPLWENYSFHSFQFRKGSDQRRVSPSQCWKLRKLELDRHLRPCVGKSFSCWCCCVTGFQESYYYQLPGITLPFPVREWAEHQTTFAMLEEQTFALVQCLASLANWMGIRAAIQFTSITSTKHRAHMQVSSSDHCERAIFSTVSIFAKGQINEECLLGNVESWESLSLADTSD